VQLRFATIGSTKSQHQSITKVGDVNLHNRIATKAGNTANNTARKNATQKNGLKLTRNLTHRQRHKSSAAFELPRETAWDKIQNFLLTPLVPPVPRWILPRHYSITLSELFGHGSFILVALSYSVNDFLTLRIIAVAGSAAMLVFTYFHPHGRVLWLPFKWNLLFIAINSYRIGKVLYNKRMATNLPLDLKKFHDEHFSMVSLMDFSKLCRIGQMETFEPKEVIVSQGQMNPYIRIVISGELDCNRDEMLTYQMTAGDFISEAGFHAGLELVGSVRATGTAINNSKNIVKTIRFHRDDLMKLLENEPSLNISLKSAASLDIIRKLKAQRRLVLNHKIYDPEEWTKKRNEMSEARYISILHNILSHHGHLDNHRKEIENYRRVHNIDDEKHVRAVKRCGWSLQEYEIGHKIEREVVDYSTFWNGFRWLK